MPKTIEWFLEPEGHDYPAAEDFLTLYVTRSAARSIVRDLRNAPMESFKARDILRASGLALCGICDKHVERTIEKIKDECKLSPILLVRGQNGLLVVDGYHRLCGVVTHDQDAKVPCKLVSM